MIGSSHCRRAKSPLGTDLIINLLGKGLTLWVDSKGLYGRWRLHLMGSCQATWQLTRGKNCIFTNFLQPILNLFIVFFLFFNRGGFNGSSGSWSKRGCKTENYTSRRTYCSCDHLTHFAVLMQLKDHEVNIFKI